MGDQQYTTRALDEQTWPAYAELIESNNGVFGGCWCMGFHSEGVGKESTPQDNCSRKQERVRSGTAHAALVFEGDSCVRWCQYGPTDGLPRIKSPRAYKKELADLPEWRIGSCFVGKGQRRAGVATAALDGALELIARTGGGVVEGYPEDADLVPAGFLFNGALPVTSRLALPVTGRSASTAGW